MNTLQTKKRTKPFILTKPIEEVLRAIHFYRYMGALDCAHLLYSPSSLTYVRSLLSRLAGGEDFRTVQYLYRFKLPDASTGSTRIYTLGSRGRDYLANDLGLPVDWYFRPYKVKHLSYSQALHGLVLTRFCVAAHAWATKQPDFRLAQTRICYELAREAATVEISKEPLPAGKHTTTEKLKVIPDAWQLFERLADGKRFPILLEIDRGMEYQQKFKRHLRSRIAFIKGGAYRRIFSTDAVVIAYSTTGDLPEYRDTRRKAICRWTMEVLRDLHMENWSHIFRVASVEVSELYSTPLFDEPLWYRPDSALPVTLFTSYPPTMKGTVYGQ